MSITISTDVFCDICSECFHGGTGRKADARRARKEAKEAGWLRCLFKGKMSDICPWCAKYCNVKGEQDA